MCPKMFFFQNLVLILEMAILEGCVCVCQNIGKELKGLNQTFSFTTIPL